MRVADNRVISVLTQYRDQLGGLYADGELKAIMRAVFQDRLGWDAAQLELRKTDVISESDLLKVYLPLKRLRAGEPLQLVLGKVDFHGIPIRVTADVLIPRPETEELVERIIEHRFRPTHVVDVGTGSGCIALALKRRLPSAHVTGIDVSPAALAVAKSNGDLNGLVLDWRCEDVLGRGGYLPGGTDLVVSNPPYIPRSEAAEMAQHVVDYEPHVALFTPDEDPLLFFRAIGAEAFKVLPVGGQLWFEGHWKYAAAVGAMLSDLGFPVVEVIKDLSGHDRFIHAER